MVVPHAATRPSTTITIDRISTMGDTPTMRRGCFSCSLVINQEDAVTIHPCGCCLCKDCMIQFLAQERLKPFLVCNFCGKGVTSHQLVRSSVIGSKVNVSYDYTKAGARSHSRGKLPPSPSLKGGGVDDDTTKKRPRKKRGKANKSNTRTNDTGSNVPPAATGGWGVANRKPASTKLDGNSATNAKRAAKRQRQNEDGSKNGTEQPATKKLCANGETNGPNMVQHVLCGKGTAMVTRSRPANYNPRRTFDEHFADLMVFRKEHGHCTVPYRSENRRLAEWVKDVRRGHLKINKEQRQRLNVAGFNWETKRNQLQREWEAKLGKLIAYKEKHGDCRVSQSYEDKQLSEWVCTQRKDYKKGKMKPNRIKALEELGFVWSPSSLPRKKPIALEQSPEADLGTEPVPEPDGNMFPAAFGFY